MIITLGISIAFSILGSLIVIYAIPAASSMFIAARLYGIDMCKKKNNTKVPESMGMISGSVFLMIMFIFLGVRFGSHFLMKQLPFPHQDFSESLAALLSVCCMLFLGFADDVLNLKWRYKLIFPTLASLPVLMVYYINLSSTTIIVPIPLRDWLGHSIDIGFLYYVYVALLAVFCTNAINIYAGVNGLESGQAIVIAMSIAIFNIAELEGYQTACHYFSLFFLLPFIGTTFGLFYYNKYPSRAFVGDTFTYFAGMTFAVVAISGHFSKTVLLFFIPQIFNFLYSVPQLFHLIPCPRHRLPRYVEEEDKVVASEFEFKESSVPNWLLFLLRMLSRFRIVRLKEGIGEDKNMCTMNNLTLINLVLVWFGPLHESKVTFLLLLLQVVSSGLGFMIRYPLSRLLYN